jgi:hypothetical protein
MPPTTEPLSRILLDETFFWTSDDEKERQAFRAHNIPCTRYSWSSNTHGGFAVSDTNGTRLAVMPPYASVCAL